MRSVKARASRSTSGGERGWNWSAEATVERATNTTLQHVCDGARTPKRSVLHQMRLRDLQYLHLRREYGEAGRYLGDQGRLLPHQPRRDAPPQVGKGRVMQDREDDIFSCADDQSSNNIVAFLFAVLI
jgi:hypothetical protein